jgi:choline dehydrogenase-like flavoprotein/DNA-binding transcriptional regulator YbjK
VIPGLDYIGRMDEPETQILAAVVRAAIPAGRLVDAGNQMTTHSVVVAMAQLPVAAQRAYSALLWALQAHCWFYYRCSVHNMHESKLVEVLQSWRTGALPKRLALKALITPIKLAHFDNPDLYRSLGCVYSPAAAKPERESLRIASRSHDASTLQHSMDIQCDVVVIGTGAGGAVVAKELAEAGVAVVMIEEGHYFKRADFNGRPAAMQKALYRSGGLTFSVGNVGIGIPIGKTVGGTTTVNSGTCYRAPDHVLRDWQQNVGLAALGPEQMDPYYSKVERIIGVTRARADLMGGCGRVIARGANAMGLTHHHPLARNAPDCDGQGVCCFGCPTDAKRSTNVSYVPLALQAGAELFYGACAKRIIFDRGKAVGVVAQSATGQQIRVNAKAVVVAAGALLTPGLLAQHRVAEGSGQLGRNLSIHPAAGCLAEFDEPIASWNGIPQGYAVEDFASEGLLFEGAATPLEFTMAMSDQVGPALTALADNFQHVASFGFMIADKSRGRIRQWQGRSIIEYSVCDQDLATMRRGVDLLAQMFFAAGAKVVHSPIAKYSQLRNDADMQRLRSAKLTARDFDLWAYHPLGTARMGVSEQHAVVSSDHEVFGSPGLFVVDGSVVPTSLGVNPQVTIMALATRAAQRIAARLQ